MMCTEAVSQVHKGETTGLYEWRNDNVSLEELEQIGI
jgi:hypothetical protein